MGRNKGLSMSPDEIAATRRVILRCLGQGLRKTASFERELTWKCYRSTIRKTAVRRVLDILKEEGVIEARACKWYLVGEQEAPTKELVPRNYQLSLGVLCPGVKAR